LKNRNTKSSRDPAPAAIGQRSETVRRANLSAIVRHLHEEGPMTRSRLAARTGLTRSAIRGLTRELVAADLVIESAPAPLGRRGRPSPLVRPNPHGAVVLALDVAVDSLAAALVGLGGTVLDSVRINRPRGHLSVDDSVADLVKLCEQVGRGRRWRAVAVAVGVAVVGVVRRSDGFVSMAPNLGWRDEPFGERLAAALALDVPVALANEADLGALAELHRGAAVGHRDVLYISGEVGVGGGLIAGGQPLTGVAGYGGEVGHIPVNPDGAPCRCGATGCWETEIGERALLARAGQPPDGGPDAVDAVLAAATSGDATALAALDEVGRWLGVGLAGLVNVLNPELVVLGGLFGRIHPFVAVTIAEALDRSALSASRELVEVVPARLGLDASLRGAAELAFEALLADPAAHLRPDGGFMHLASA
jgi:predicted NBD/HSP70 family sugar kinase